MPVSRDKRLNDEGRKSLIRSLESNLLQDDTESGIQCYVTLGALSGKYYSNYKPTGLGSAFPYKERPYFIQYQAWWNDTPEDIQLGKEHNVYCYTNEAEDWIDRSRQRDFPQTNGSFISFKDSSVPTKDYFLESFEELKKIKKQYSKDPTNKLRTRKTII